jgi:hypothetical protein
LVAVLLVWAMVAIPVAMGARTFFVRDVLVTHLPYKAFGAKNLAEGRIPALNPTWALGQPFAGNPNALPFYPGNLLYLVLPFWSAFNLHYALHWLLALLTMYALARELKLSPTAAIMAALTYAAGGWFLSAMTFYNLLTVAAWWPLAIKGAVRGGRNGVVLGGMACGLALLGGEPVTMMLGFPPLLLLAASRHGWRKGLLITASIGVVGAVIGLPQIVATLRSVGFTIRGGSGLPVDRPSSFTFHPIRFLELVIPLPFGWPAELGHRKFWTSSILPQQPYFYSIYIGIVGLWLAWRGRRVHQAWTLLAAAGLVLSMLGRVSPRILNELSGGTFRYTEKFLFWFALAVALMAGAGLDRLAASRDSRERGAWTAAGVLLGLAGVLALIRTPFLAAVGKGLEANPEITTAGEAANAMASAEFHFLLWLVGLAIGGLVLAAAIAAARWRLVGVLLGLQLVGLLQLFPLVQTTKLAPLRQPSPWLEMVGEGSAFANNLFGLAKWFELPPYQLQHETEAEAAELRAMDLDTPFGILAGLSYPLAEDLEGIYSPLYGDLPRALAGASWPERANWLRVLGVEHTLSVEDPAQEGLEWIASADRFGVSTSLYRVVDPAPPVWWPDRVGVESTPMSAYLAVGAASDPIAEVVVPQPVSHTPGGRVRVVTWSSDRMVVDVESGRGVLVLRRAFQDLLVAKTNGQELETVPVNLCQLGVVVPAGSHRVSVTVARWPEIISAAIALVAFLAALWWLGSPSIRTLFSRTSV